MLDQTVTRWLGILLSAFGVVATLWLAATGQLTLYIHPRYVVFTTVMAVIGGLLVIGAVVLTFRSSRKTGSEATTVLDSVDDRIGHDHTGRDHDHDATPRSPLRRRLSTVGAIVLVAAAATALLALPPASLSTGALTAGELDTTSSTTLDDAPDLVGGDSSQFNVKDWAALLRQGLTAGDLAGMNADVIGFVAPDPSGSSDLFYLARYSITCCAVDAQPIAIPVESTRWADAVTEGGWVRVTGAFRDSANAGTPTVLDAQSIEKIDEPSDPYVF